MDQPKVAEDRTFPPAPVYKVHLIIVCWRFPRLSVKTTQGSSGNYREWGFPLLPLRHRFIRSMKPLQFILFSITCNGEVKKGKTRLDCTDQNCLQRFVRCQMSGWGRSLGTLDRSSTRPKIWKGFTSHILHLLSFVPVWSMAIVGGATKDRRRSDKHKQSQAVVSIVCHLGDCLLLRWPAHFFTAAIACNSLSYLVNSCTHKYTSSHLFI